MLEVCIYEWVGWVVTKYCSIYFPHHGIDQASLSLLFRLISNNMMHLKEKNGLIVWIFKNITLICIYPEYSNGKICCCVIKKVTWNVMYWAQSSNIKNDNG